MVYIVPVLADVPWRWRVRWRVHRSRSGMRRALHASQAANTRRTRRLHALNVNNTPVIVLNLTAYLIATNRSQCLL